MSPFALDHVVIHIDDWQKSNDFYRVVLGAELVENPEGAHNPLGAWAYRIGEQQLNVHGPWPGLEMPCCEPPRNEPGRADLCFRNPGSAADASALLGRHRIAIEGGPLPRFGAAWLGHERLLPRPERQLDRAHLLRVTRHSSPTRRFDAPHGGVDLAPDRGTDFLLRCHVDPDRDDDPPESVVAPGGGRHGYRRLPLRRAGHDGEHGVGDETIRADGRRGLPRRDDEEVWVGLLAGRLSSCWRRQSCHCELLRIAR